MFKTIRNTIALATIILCSANAQALDFEWVGKSWDVLKIYSSEPGAETFIVSSDGQVVSISHHFDGGESTTYLSAGLIDAIVFEGDDDRDEFYNWSNEILIAYGNGGNDVLLGGSAADRLSGGPGKDYLYGGDGPDLLFPGQDLEEGEIHGGNGDDWAQINTIEVQVMFYRFQYRPSFETTPQSIEEIERPVITMGLDEFLDSLN